MAPASHAFSEHTSELRIHLRADSLEGLFLEAARALTEVMVGTGEPAQLSEPQTVVVRAPDRDALLVEWLNEILFVCERDKQVIEQITIHRISNTEIEASLRGRPATELRTEVKAATFHGLAIRTTAGQLSADVILDV